MLAFPVCLTGLVNHLRTGVRAARAESHCYFINHRCHSAKCLLPRLPYFLFQSPCKTFIMYFRFVLLRSTLILSIVLVASIINSALTLSFEDVSAQNDLLTFDQTTLDFSSLNDPPLDLTAPFFDAENSPTYDALKGFDLSENSDINSSDLFGGDLSQGGTTFQLADCSTSEIPVAFGPSRVKRNADDGSSCTNPAASGSSSDDSNLPALMLPQEFDSEKHSITCFQLTLGVLPFAVVSSGDQADVINDRSRLYTVTSMNMPYSPSTLYRATVSMHWPAPFFPNSVFTRFGRG